MQPNCDFFLRLRLPDKESHREHFSTEDDLFEYLPKLCFKCRHEPAHAFELQRTFHNTAGRHTQESGIDLGIPI
jgi:hypothetical protein